MKQLFMLLVLLLPLTVPAQTQPVSSPVLLLGGELSPYRGNPFGLDIKFVRDRKPSFGLKLNLFDYEDPRPVSINSNLYTNEPHIEQAYSIRGITLKPSVSLLNRVTPNHIITWSQSLVLSQASHEMQINYSDIMGHTTQHHTRTSLTFGFESDVTYHQRIFRLLYISASARLGYKPTSVRLFDDVIRDYPSFYDYAPSQGYGKSALYVNVSLGAGIVL